MVGISPPLVQKTNGSPALEPILSWRDQRVPTPGRILGSRFQTVPEDLESCGPGDQDTLGAIGQTDLRQVHVSRKLLFTRDSFLGPRTIVIQWD